MPKNNIEDMMDVLYRNTYRSGAFLLVTGDADFDDYAFMESELDRLIFIEDFCGDIGLYTVKIITGLEGGAEELAVRYADKHAFSKILFSTNKDFHQQLAVSLRNEDMFRLATHVIVFWDGKQNDTANFIYLAEQSATPCKVILYMQES